MKSYTDIEQSKKLAEILPLESADMSINHSLFHNMTTVLTTPYKKLHEFFSGDTPDTTLPCWSLAALLIHIPNVSVHHTPSGWRTDSSTERVTVFGPSRDNPIDAAVEMILKLKENNVL